ncbi:hypothetical protein ACA910_018912 [Epithemia clementina (nom. ined.)]
MVKSVDPAILQMVVTSWSKLKEFDDYENVAGQKVMKFLFEKCPKAKPMFGYDLYAEVDDLTSDPKFIAHSKQLITMFDMTFNMMGPDGHLVSEQIKALGEKHVAYGVQAEMFPIMGKALKNMLKEIQGDEFTTELHDAWRSVFGVIAQELMITVLKSKSKKDGVAQQVTNNPVAA